MKNMYKKINENKASGINVREYDIEKMFDENGMLIIPGGRKWNQK
jgi:hypothetical protein